MNLPNIESDFWRLWRVVVTYIPEEHVDAAWEAYKEEYFHGKHLPPAEYDKGLKKPFRKPKTESMNELATRLRKEAQSYAQDAEERKALREAHELARAAAQDTSREGESPVKPTDPWGEATDTRGYPEK